MGNLNIFDFFDKDIVYHLYQPLIDLSENQTIYAYEALFRNNSNISPDIVFHSATRANILYQLDTMSIQKAISTFFEKNLSECHLFLNIYITTVLHPNFFHFFNKLCEKYTGLPNKLFFEINETSAEELWINPLLKRSFQTLRNLGVRFAIDDFGQGSSSIKKAIEYEPECIKLDRYFATNLAQDKNKQRFLSLFRGYYDKDTLLVIEGIEEKEDLIVAKQIGLHIAQGFYLGMPRELELVN
jgi:EAL domain-containing protein (putative c-di-GMP-specific phosphodiesterase class I)